MYPAHTLLPFGTDYGKSPAHWILSEKWRLSLKRSVLRAMNWNPTQTQSSGSSLSFCLTPTTCRSTTKAKDKKTVTLYWGRPYRVTYCVDRSFKKEESTTKGRLYPFLVSGAAGDACSPSPHLSPQSYLYYPKKRYDKAAAFVVLQKSTDLFFVGMFKCEQTETCMRYTSKHRLCDTTKALIRENPWNP